MVDEIEKSGVFSAAATYVLALYTTDAAFSADRLDVLPAVKATSDVSCPTKVELWGVVVGDDA